METKSFFLSLQDFLKYKKKNNIPANGGEIAKHLLESEYIDVSWFDNVAKNDVPRYMAKKGL